MEVDGFPYMEMFRSYTTRLKTTRRQGVMLSDLLEHLCVLYNSALSERKNSYPEKRVSLYDQQKSLTLFREKSKQVREFPAFAQRDPLRRIDLAFKEFFRRRKRGEHAGYPRFKAISQYDSFCVDSQNFRLTGDSIEIVKLGTFRFKTGYKIKGTPKTVRIKRNGNKWLAFIVCDVGLPPTKVTVKTAVGIDLGISSFITLSDGRDFPNPRWQKLEEESLSLASKSLSRKKRDSNNRIKAKNRLRRVYQRVAGLRRYWETGVAKKLVDRYDLIAYEDLEIANMARSNLSKSIKDSSWGKFIWRLKCEAEKAGKWVIPINPRGTSQECSGCGDRVPKTLSVRVHVCPNCNLSIGRDHNAALNILNRGMRFAPLGTGGLK